MVLELAGHEMLGALAHHKKVSRKSCERDKQPALSFWSPESWTCQENYQPLCYSLTDEAFIRQRVIPELRSYPALVAEAEIQRLAMHLKAMAVGGRASPYSFILQGGYCAESFDDACPAVVNTIVSTLRDCAKTLSPTRSHRFILLPRIAGQYGKPRTQPVENVDADGNNGTNIQASPSDRKVTLSYRGDIFHGFDLAHRAPDPGRIRQAYHAARATLDILHESYGSASPHSAVALGQNMFTSHEAFCLPYEEALLRLSSPTLLQLDGCAAPPYYNSSGHFLWLGERTSQLDGAHIELLRGISNPIGIKLGPKKTAIDLLHLLDRLNPNRVPGRVTLITRLGWHSVRQYLPEFIIAVRRSQHPVLWICDPMHGNTLTVSVPVSVTEMDTAATATARKKDYKTRYFDHILEEIRLTLEIHRSFGSLCSGLHLELTGDEHATECIGGVDSPVTIDSLPLAYSTKCDPRLNKRQALDLMRALRPLVDI